MLLNEHIDELNHERMVPMYVYVIECAVLPGFSFYKVGIASSVPARLEALQIACPIDLRIRHYRKVERGTARTVEKAIHAELAPYRKRGEWFTADHATVWAAFKRGVTAARARHVTIMRQRTRRYLTKAAKREGVEF